MNTAQDCHVRTVVQLEPRFGRRYRPMGPFKFFFCWVQDLGVGIGVGIEFGYGQLNSATPLLHFLVFSKS